MRGVERSPVSGASTGIPLLVEHRSGGRRIETRPPAPPTASVEA